MINSQLDKVSGGDLQALAGAPAGVELFGQSAQLVDAESGTYMAFGFENGPSPSAALKPKEMDLLSRIHRRMQSSVAQGQLKLTPQEQGKMTQVNASKNTPMWGHNFLALLMMADRKRSMSLVSQYGRRSDVKAVTAMQRRLKIGGPRPAMAPNRYAKLKPVYFQGNMAQSLERKAGLDPALATTARSQKIALTPRRPHGVAHYREIKALNKQLRPAMQPSAPTPMAARPKPRGKRFRYELEAPGPTGM